MNGVFENKRFVVVVVGAAAGASPITLSGLEFHAYYAVVNKETGVTEMYTPGLVEAIMYSENCDRVLETRPWEWARQETRDASVPTQMSLDLGKAN